MFDTSAMEGAAESNVRPELFQDTLTVGLSSEAWNLNHHHHHGHQQQQVHAVLPPHASSFSSGGMDTNYLPPLIENMDNMVPPGGHHHDQVQSCSMEEDQGDHHHHHHQMGLDCLQRQELNEWVECQQQCPNFLFWDNVMEGHELGGEMVNPTSSSSLGAINSLSSFPSSL